jgi:alpha-tubulin suppressor-like RCC1 family protein
MTTNYRINGTDTDDLFIRKDLFTEGGLWLWGSNQGGQLGTNDIVHRSSPVQTVSGGTNWKQVSAGLTDPGHAAAIKTDGTLWLWGQNIFGIVFGGQLGTNDKIHRSSPVQTVSGGTNWRQVSCGTDFTAAIKTDGTLWLWGSNGGGQLGDNTSVSKSSPVQTIAAGTNWKQVSGSAAIKTDGTLWLWGSNANGQLGDNSITSRSSPVQTIAAGTNWKQVSGGKGILTAAIKTDGTLWLWGRNTDGQLGTNDIVHRSSPVQTVSGGTDWKQVNTNTTHIAAIKTDGTLWLWGKNTYGQLGDSSTTHRSSPVQTVSGGTNWKQVACGAEQTAAIKTDGTLWVWGYNVYGQLADNTTVSKSSPVQTVSGGTNWKQVDSGAFSVISIRGDYWA